MRLTEEAKKLPGVEEAVVAMGTETNRRLLRDLGLLGKEGEGAGDGDLVLAVRVAAGADAGAALKKIEEMLMSPPTAAQEARASIFHSLDSALERFPKANLAVVSLPGTQAYEPTMELLKKGINVHLFSDHVPRDQEAELKRFASSKGLLVLGPGAGTCIINGVGLGFANSVRQGRVGIVASAGTGIQEVSVLLDRVGLGVSHALGVGGSDVSEQIGGIMMKDCLSLLDADPGTETIMIVAKTPTPSVVANVMGYVDEKTTKPVVACFLGMDTPATKGGRVRYAKTLHSAVAAVTQISGEKASKEFHATISKSLGDLSDSVLRLHSSLAPAQKHIRGLYSGGTLAHETLLILKQLLGEPYSNTPLTSGFTLEDPGTSRDNSVVDLGDEFFTAGRAHPMIDPTLRRLRILQEGNDPTVAVIMLDIVLGYGSSSDPSGGLTGAIEESRAKAVSQGRDLIFMAHVCGTERDPQSLEDQNNKLARAGVVLFSSNAQMSAAAALLVGGDVARSQLSHQWRDLFGEE
jgi:succinyl-CoA synthetase alpha subunit